MKGLLTTAAGGKTWTTRDQSERQRVEMGKTVNKIRLLEGTGYAIGAEVYSWWGVAHRG